MALIETNGNVISVLVVDFTRKVNDIKLQCEAARASTTQTTVAEAYRICWSAHNQIQALETTHTRAALLQYATDYTDKDWNSFALEHAQMMDVDLPAFLSGVESGVNQFGIQAFSNGQQVYGNFNAGQTSGFQNLLDDVLANFL